MEVVCYCDENGNNPINEYSKNLPLSMNAFLKARIGIIAQNKGMKIPYSKPLTGYPFSEMTKLKKNAGRLIRILYACVGGRMVLFHMFDKPDHDSYNKREQEQIKKEFEIALERYNNYLANRNLCKIYEIPKEV